MFEFVLIVYLTMDSPEYKGNFVDCATANSWVEKYYPDAPYTACLHEDYINLPKHFIKREVHYGQGK